MRATAWFYSRGIHGQTFRPEVEPVREIDPRMKPLPADIALLNHDEVVERLNQYSVMSVEEKFGGKTREQIQNFMYRYDALCFRLTEILEGRG